MKKILLLAFIVSTIALTLSAQENERLPRFENGVLYTTSGYNIAINDQVRLGTGSTPDGNFKFIRRNSASLLNYTSNTGPNYANNANAGPRSMSGHDYKVVKIEPRGTKKIGYVFYCVIQGFPRYEIDIENAIAFNEVLVPDQFKKALAPASAGNTTPSLADELKKLKDLYDAGALTKDEYEAAKKKLLN